MTILFVGVAREKVVIVGIDRCSGLSMTNRLVGATTFATREATTAVGRVGFDAADTEEVEACTVEVDVDTALETGRGGKEGATRVGIGGLTG